MIALRTDAAAKKFGRPGRKLRAGALSPAFIPYREGQVEIALYESVLKNQYIPPTEKNVLRYIIFRSHANSRICYFTQTTAARELGLSSCRISRAVAWLREHAYIKTKFNGHVLHFELCSTIKPALSHEQSCFAPRANRTSIELEKKESPLPPASGGPQNLSYVSWGGELIEVDSGRTKRLLTDKERHCLHGARAHRMLEFLQAKGFRARIVPKEEVDSWQENTA